MINNVIWRLVTARPDRQESNELLIRLKNLVVKCTECMDFTTLTSIFQMNSALFLKLLHFFGFENFIE